MANLPSVDALASERKHNAFLRKVIYVVFAFGIFGMYLTYTIPKNINLHIPPDISQGAEVKLKSGVQSVPAPNVYAFGYYIWQQVNRWPADGMKEYGKQIYDLQNYFTPSCRQQLEGDLKNRASAGELLLRTRYVTEIPGFGYSANRVTQDGANAWVVKVDMQVSESLRGQTIKDVYIRYPLRIVRFDIDREKNPWGLAIDCFGGDKPARINEAEVKAAMESNKNNNTVVPATLPATSDHVEPAAPVVPAQTNQDAPVVDTVKPTSPAPALVK